MSFGLYSMGFAILIGGLMYGAHLMRMPARWIVVGELVLCGVGVLTGVKNTRQKDPVGQGHFRMPLASAFESSQHSCLLHLTKELDH